VELAARLHCSYKRATFVLCAGNLVVALYLLQSVLGPFYFQTSSSSSSNELQQQGLILTLSPFSFSHLLSFHPFSFPFLFFFLFFFFFWGAFFLVCCPHFFFFFFFFFMPHHRVFWICFLTQQLLVNICMICFLHHSLPL
jgi:hypothetical protein